MDHDELSKFEATLAGRACKITRREADWLLDFGDGVGVALGAPWRIVSNGRIAITADDDGHQFGHSSAVDSAAKAATLLSGKRISVATVDRFTADLSLQFDPGTRLDVFHNSSAYEGWQAWADDDPRLIIALGGGEIVLAGEAS